MLLRPVAGGGSSWPCPAICDADCARVAEPMGERSLDAAYRCSADYATTENALMHLLKNSPCLKLLLQLRVSCFGSFVEVGA